MENWFQFPGQSAINLWFWKILFMCTVTRFSQVFLMGLGFCWSLWLAKKVMRSWKMEKKELWVGLSWSLKSLFLDSFSNRYYLVLFCLLGKGLPIFAIILIISLCFMVVFIKAYILLCRKTSQQGEWWVSGSCSFIHSDSVVGHKLCIRHCVRQFKSSQPSLGLKMGCMETDLQTNNDNTIYGS